MRFAPSILLLLLAAPAIGQQPAYIAPTDPKSPAEERASFTVPDGFEVQLVASEPDIQKPIQMAFDARGRLWVTTSHHYPFPGDPGKANDKLYILSDFGPDGKARKVQVFADTLNIPIGILPLPDCNSCIVSSVGQILKLTDTDGDGKADKTEVLFSGFGTRDTHGMCNSFTFMPDGWVYACHGYLNSSRVKGKDGFEVEMNSGNTFRFRPDGSRIEVYTRGQVNPFGIAVDPWFNLYTADCHSKPITQLIPGAHYDSFGKPHDGLGYAPHVTPHDHGSTALCGLAWYDADQFPKEYKGCMFLGNVVTNRVNFDRIEWRGATPVAKELPDFLTSKDLWFRPADIKLGPDGALYITDFYNRIIGHYEVDLRDPRRDKDRGRVWRVVWKGKDGSGKPPQAPFSDLTQESAGDLVKRLESPNLTVRLAAVNQLRSRPPGWHDAFPHQKGADTAGVKNIARVYAPFPMMAENAGILKENDYASFFAVITLAGDDPAGVEMAVGIARGLATRKDLGSETRQMLVALLQSKSDIARRAAAETMSFHRHPEFVKPLVELIQKCPANDTHLRHAARVALRNCLENPRGWGAVMLLPEESVAVVTDVAIAIPNAYVAAYFTKMIAKKLIKDDKLLIVVDFVGRYANYDDLVKVIEWTNQASDVAKAATIFQTIIRGMQTRPYPPRLRAEDTNMVLMRARSGLLEGSPEQRSAVLKLLVDLPAVFPENYSFQGIVDIDPVPAVGGILSNSHQPDSLRVVAVDALVKLDAKAGYAGAVSLIDSPASSPVLREKAGLVLAGSADRNHKMAAKDAIKSVPYRSGVVIATALAGSQPGGLILLDAVKDGKAPARVLQEKAVLDRLRAAGIPDLNKQLAGLTKGLQPADQKLAELLKLRATKFVSAKADPVEGAKLFTKHCAACHKIGDQGGKVGPNLDGIGARGLERLLEDTLDPNRNVDVAFRARVLTLTDGTTKTGLMLRVEGQVVVMADDQGKEYRVPTKEIESNRETALSPMPANFGEVIPETEFAHLMAYLLAQRVKEPPPK